MKWAVCGLAVLTAVSLPAQDAARVATASRVFRSQKTSLPLTPEQRVEAERLAQEADQEGQMGRFGEALRRYAQASAVMHGVAWTPAVEFASSLEARVDHAMLDPGGPVLFSLVALYSCGQKPEARLLASVYLGADVPVETGLARGAVVEPARLPFTARLTAPLDANGNYRLEARLSVASGSTPEALRQAFRKSVPVHIEPLSHEASRLRDRLAALGSRRWRALPSAEYPLAFYERADRGTDGVRRYRNYSFPREFAAAQDILDALEAGGDPFATKRGDFRKAYRSAVDQTLQPYRVFVPDSYDGAHATPLVVALHGAGGDENTMFDGFPGASLAAEAARVGFVVVCPRGRAANSGYQGEAERDVFDVLAEVERDYRIDPSRIYLMGHSMGAFATWRLAMDHPNRFAALGPIAGGGDPAGMVKIRHIPQYVVHGAADETVPVSRSREMAEAGRKQGAPIVYVEVAGAGHYEAAVSQFGAMLDFFAKQSRSAAR